MTRLLSDPIYIRLILNNEFGVVKLSIIINMVIAFIFDPDRICFVLHVRGFCS